MVGEEKGCVVKDVDASGLVGEEGQELREERVWGGGVRPHAE